MEQRERVEPLGAVRDHRSARAEAAGALWRNHEGVTAFACRGGGIRGAVRLPPLTGAAIGAVLALAANGALQGSASVAFQWSCTALAMYDILGTRAPLADPRAIPSRMLSPLPLPSDDGEEHQRPATAVAYFGHRARNGAHDVLVELVADYGLCWTEIPWRPWLAEQDGLTMTVEEAERAWGCPVELLKLGRVERVATG